MVKHEFRVMSYGLRVTSYKLRVESLKARFEIQKCQFKSTSYEFKSLSYKLKSTGYEFESKSYQFESTSYEFESMSQEYESTSYQLESTSSRIITSYSLVIMSESLLVQEFKSQLNILKSSSFPKTISPKLFGNFRDNLHVQFLAIISYFTFPPLWKKRPKFSPEKSPPPRLFSRKLLFSLVNATDFSLISLTQIFVLCL